MNDLDKIVVALQTARKVKALSIRQLSCLSGISASAISRIERESPNMNMKTFQALSSALGFSIEEVK